MSKVLRFPNKQEQHIYELNRCAGCQKTFKEGESYTQVSMPNFDKGKKHIALCNSCSHVSRQHGVNV